MAIQYMAIQWNHRTPPVMVAYPYDLALPSTEELPCSDDTPVDNGDQNLLPNPLRLALTTLWADRWDGFFGVDMAVYHITGPHPRVPVVPDAVLSLGVARKKDGKSRRSYATWEENGVVPTLVLEMVCHRPNQEDSDKRALYHRLGVLYYVVYNPEGWQRDRHQPFEPYQRVGDDYTLQIGEPYGMPEIGLGLGRGRQVIGGLEQEVLLWHEPYPLPEQELQQVRAALAAERQRTDPLVADLCFLGLDPEDLLLC